MEWPLGRNVCHVCKGMGYVTPDCHPGHPSFGKAIPCSCGEQEIRQRMVDRAFVKAGIPMGYRKLRFNDFVERAQGDEHKQRAIALVRQVLHEGKTDEGKRGIMLWGPTGTGKTGCLTPAFAYLIQQGASGLWMNYAEFMASTRDFESGQVNERIEVAKSVDLLFIDDLLDPAAKGVTDWAREILYRILEYRAAFDKATFITTNVNPKAVASKTHERLLRRIEMMCSVAMLGGKPFDELEYTIPKGA